MLFTQTWRESVRKLKLSTQRTGLLTPNNVSASSTITNCTDAFLFIYFISVFNDA